MSLNSFRLSSSCTLCVINAYFCPICRMLSANHAVTVKIWVRSITPLLLESHSTLRSTKHPKNQINVGPSVLVLFETRHMAELRTELGFAIPHSVFMMKPDTWLSS